MDELSPRERQLLSTARTYKPSPRNAKIVIVLLVTGLVATTVLVIYSVIQIIQGYDQEKGRLLFTGCILWAWLITQLDSFIFRKDVSALVRKLHELASD